MAMQQRNREAAELLLQAGAMVNAQDHVVSLLTELAALRQSAHLAIT